MKRGKLFALVTFAVLAVYCVSSVFVYRTEREMCSKNVELNCERLDSLAEHYVNVYSSAENYSDGISDKEDYEAEYELMRKYLPDIVIFSTHKDMSFSYVDPYPTMLVMKEKNGKTSQSRSLIKYSKYETDELERSRLTEFFICDLEKYLTDEVKKELAEYMDSPYERLNLDEASFKFADDEYIPVKITLSGYNKVHRTFDITNYKPDLTITSADELVNLEIMLYDIDENADEHNSYKRLRKELANIDGGGCRIENWVAGSKSIDFDGKYYVLNTGVSQNLFKAVQKNNFHQTERILFNFVFIIVLIVVLLTANSLYKKNQRLNEATQSFSAAAAHELKTPLCVIQNQCECVIENITPEKNEEYIRSIYDETLRMNKMVASLLQYSKITSAANIKKSRCDLAQIVSTEAKKHMKFAEANGAKIILNIPQKKAYIRCNSDLVSAAIGNFLSNAVKYSSGEKRIIVTVKGDGLSYSVAVYNDGKGVPNELKNSIWNILSKADKSRTSGNGSGIGLAINKRIFEFHSYQYGYHNTDCGVEFWFET